MILLDGKRVAASILETIKAEVAERKKKLRLGIVVVGNDPVVHKFIVQKKKSAEEVGIDVRIYPFEEIITTRQLRARLVDIVHEEKNTGVIVQLPLPSHINRQSILNAITPEKDVDVLSARAVGDYVVEKSNIVPPVVGAVQEILTAYEITIHDKEIVILGVGTLVGKPIAMWLLQEKATFTIVRSSTKKPQRFLKAADIIISGLGKPKFINSDMIKEGAVLIDAGTSESEGKIVGDVDIESVKEKAAYVTPVPGGIGPLTVAVLLRNLVLLSRKQ